MKFLFPALFALAAVVATVVFYRYTHSNKFLFAVHEGTSTDQYIMFTANKNGFAGHASLIIERRGENLAVPFGLRPIGSAKDGLISAIIPKPGSVAGDSYSRPDPTYSPTIAMFLSDEQAERLLKEYERDRDAASITYQLGSNDCVAFSKKIAKELGLEVPSSIFSHVPRYYITEMIRLNLDRLKLSDTHHARELFPSKFSVGKSPSESTDKPQ